MSLGVVRPAVTGQCVALQRSAPRARPFASVCSLCAPGPRRGSGGLARCATLHSTRRGPPTGRLRPAARPGRLGRSPRGASGAVAGDLPDAAEQLGRRASRTWVAQAGWSTATTSTSPASRTGRACRASAGPDDLLPAGEHRASADGRRPRRLAGRSGRRLGDRAGPPRRPGPRPAAAARGPGPCGRRRRRRVRRQRLAGRRPAPSVAHVDHARPPPPPPAGGTAVVSRAWPGGQLARPGPGCGGVELGEHVVEQQDRRASRARSVTRRCTARRRARARQRCSPWEAWSRASRPAMAQLQVVAVRARRWSRPAAGRRARAAPSASAQRSLPASAGRPASTSGSDGRRADPVGQRPA